MPPPVLWLTVFSPVHFLSGSSILEPFVLSSGSSNRTSSSDSSVRSYHRLRYRLGQTFFDPDVGMASADLGPVDEGFGPLNPIEVDPNARSESEGSVNQGEISSDHTESANPGAQRDGNGASVGPPDVQIVGVHQPRNNNSGSIYEPSTELPPSEPIPRSLTVENPSTENPIAEDHSQGTRPPRTKTSEKETNTYLHFFSGEPGEYEAFCEEFNIPADVEVRLVPRDQITFTEDHITLPLITITEGGV